MTWLVHCNSTDRWIMGVTALMIAGLLLRPWYGLPQGHYVEVLHDNQLVLTLPLQQDSRHQVAGNLGPVAIEVRGGRARLLEYRSPRLIGTYTGWIEHHNAVAVCVPCGVLIRVRATDGQPVPSGVPFDAVAH
ncbi:MAG: NusG domain II-containing protein [Magnetococcales bacterium]|nr:NusG domain II-containing protein [Magnetococcales bacterium]